MQPEDPDDHANAAEDHRELAEADELALEARGDRTTYQPGDLEELERAARESPVPSPPAPRV
jgi:hypothetical protein